VIIIEVRADFRKAGEFLREFSFVDD